MKRYRLIIDVDDSQSYLFKSSSLKKAYYALSLSLDRFDKGIWRIELCSFNLLPTVIATGAFGSSVGLLNKENK